MPHIHTEPGQIDHTASAYIILREHGAEPKLLLHMHKKLGVLLQPGGHIELDETPWQAVAHEIEEETGYTLAELQVMQPQPRIMSCGESVLHPQPLFMNTHSFGKGLDHYHSDTIYLLLAIHPPTGAPQEGESQDIRWLTRSEIMVLNDEQMFAHTRNIAVAIFDTFLDTWQPLPATDFSLSLPSLR